MRTIDELDFAGIYLLKFNDMYHYVGKSVCIRDRLYQHISSFEKGDAAVRLQDAYDEFGPPEISVLLECHADNIDVLEAWFINAYAGPTCLNTCILKNPFPGADGAEIDRLVDEHSSMAYRTLSNAIADYERICDVQSTTIQKHLAKINILEVKRSAEEVQADVEKRINQLEDDCSFYKSAMDDEMTRVNELEARLKKLIELPWYRKIFI
jgi:hypothetical protein